MTHRLLKAEDLAWWLIGRHDAPFRPSYFFFQAEDGIRDGRVTGFQTCALPILRSQAIVTLPGATCTAQDVAQRLTSDGYVVVSGLMSDGDVAAARADLDRVLAATPTGRNEFRSEERRVGTEPSTPRATQPARIR